MNRSYMYRIERMMVRLCALCLCVLVLSATVSASNIRGRIDTYNAYTRAMMPTPGIVITLFMEHGMNNWVPVTQTTSDRYGFYYFNNLHYGNYRAGPYLQNTQPFWVTPQNVYYNFDVPLLQMR